jgi:replicative DNA helicase
VPFVFVQYQNLRETMNTIAAPEQYDLQTAALKVPPHSIEAEQAVLGGLMLDNDAWERVLDLVSDGDFYRHDHRLIFRAITKLADHNQPFDVVTLSEMLDKEGQTAQTGGLAYLGELAKNTPSVANIKAYAQIVRERATLRQLIGISSEVADSAFNPQGRNAAEILDEAERKIFQIAEARPKTGGPVSVNALLTKAIDRIDTLFNTGGGITGLSTGYTDLDEMTSGLQPADLIIVAGRPSMGKTTFAMNLVENAVLRSDKAVLVYSLEMPGDSLIMRMLSSLGRIDQTKVRAGRLDDDDWPRLTSAVNLLNDRKLFIDDTAGISPSEMRARTRRLVREHGDLAMIMIDYLQLMQVAGSSGDNRTNEISEISRSLKALAKEFNCPVVALSQLNRSLEQRPNKRPINSDLRESGAIEQDADVIMFVYRDEVYHPETEYKGIAEIIIGKQRNGPIGTTRLAFLGKYTRFENLAPGSYQFDDE